jgi:hypothetical protein
MKPSTLGFMALALAAAADAGAHELIGGWEGGPSNDYAFIEPVFSFPETGNGSAFVLRPTIEYLYYEARETSGLTKVSSPGVSLGIGWRLRTPRLTLTIGPGYEARWERRNLSDGTELKDTLKGFTASADAFFQANPLTNLFLITTYGDANHYAWTRAGIKRQVTNVEFKRSTAISLGVELTEQGNSDVRRDQAGGLLEFAFLNTHTSLQLRSGYSRSRNADGSIQRQPYFGIGVYKAL